MGLAAVSRALSPARSARIRCGTEFLFKFKPPDHNIHQVVPTGKAHRACKGSEIIKKGWATGKRLASQRILLITPRQDGMEQKRQQIETEQKRRQVSLAVAKVMFDMIAFGLEHVVVFVFDFPPPAACSGKVGNVVSRDPMIGDKAVVIALFARVGMHRGDLKPIHRPGILTAAQPHIVARAIQHDVAHAAAAVALLNFLHGLRLLPKGQALIERGMRVGLAHQDEVEAGCERTCTQRVIAVKIIAKQGDMVRGDLPGVVLAPAFARDPLAVLVVVTVLRHDEFRWHGNHLGTARTNDHRGNRRVIGTGVTVCALTLETVRAMDVARGIVLSAIERHQQLPIENTKAAQ